MEDPRHRRRSGERGGPGPLPGPQDPQPHPSRWTLERPRDRDLHRPSPSGADCGTPKVLNVDDTPLPLVGGHRRGGPVSTPTLPSSTSPCVVSVTPTLRPAGLRHPSPPLRGTDGGGMSEVGIPFLGRPLRCLSQYGGVSRRTRDEPQDPPVRPPLRGTGRPAVRPPPLPSVRGSRRTRPEGGVVRTGGEERTFGSVAQVQGPGWGVTPCMRGETVCGSDREGSGEGTGHDRTSGVLDPQPSSSTATLPTVLWSVRSRSPPIRTRVLACTLP